MHNVMRTVSEVKQTYKLVIRRSVKGRKMFNNIICALSLIREVSVVLTTRKLFFRIR